MCFPVRCPISIPTSLAPEKISRKRHKMTRWALVLLSVLLAIVDTGCSGIVAGRNNPGPAPPSISTQPASQTVSSGQTATFSVTATGTAPLAYQWKKNSVAISGAMSSAYTTAATTSSDSGAQFTVVVSNAAGSVTSSAAMLTVNPAAVAPSITMQPASQTVSSGQTATFSVTATGTAPLAYQWKKNSVAISGAMSSAYTTAATTDRKSTRLNSSHLVISYAVFCLKKK